jgi:hypothetical protein
MKHLWPGMVALVILTIASCSSTRLSSRADDIADPLPVNWSPAEAKVAGSQVTLHFVDFAEYNASDPCTARFTAAVSESVTEVHIKVTRWRPRPTPPATFTGCFLIGHARTLKVKLNQPLQNRRLVNDT